MKAVIARMSVCMAMLLMVGQAAAQYTIVNTLPGSFTDISQSGNFVDLGDEDEAFAFTMPIGNGQIPFGSSVIIGNNGGVGFSPPSTNLGPTPAALPSIAAFGAGKALLPYWADIGNHVGAIHWKALPGVVIIQWTAKPSKPFGAPGTFQIKIFGGTPGPAECVYAQFIYQDIEGPGWNGGANASIGYQNELLAPAQWSLNTAEAVHNGTVLSLVNTECYGGQPCTSDFNGDGFVNGDDYDLFVDVFDAGGQSSDLNLDGFVNGDDYDVFASHFEAGC
ncbi:MAG: hypothetical protein U0638_04665 [Phycisphaerales bacterium]